MNQLSTEASNVDGALLAILEMESPAKVWCHISIAVITPVNPQLLRFEGKN